MNQKELKELIEFLIEKDIAEFELERGDVKVKIKRGAEHTVVHSRAEPPYRGRSGSCSQRRLPAAAAPAPPPAPASRLPKKICTS